MEPPMKRFASLSAEEIGELVNEKDSKNTQKATKNSLATLQAFCEETDRALDHENITKQELNELLLSFYANARKKNGERYKKTAFTSLRFGLQRHFMAKREFNIITEPEFTKSNKVFEAAVADLKRQGFGKVDHREAISKEDLEKVQLSYSNSLSSDPAGLQKFVWFNTMFHLCRRGRENLRLQTKLSFAVKVDAAGRRYVYQAVDELDKNHRENDLPSDSTGEGRMYDIPGSPRCPVKAFELYVSKLHPHLNSLWQRPKAKEQCQEQDEVWYCNANLGKNTLGGLMSTISKEQNLSQNYTNHCIRATAVSLLDECNFEARHIMRISGHKSESSIRSYSRRLSEEKQREISYTLSSATASSSEARISESQSLQLPCESEIQPVSSHSSPGLMQNFASHSRETAHFHSGSFSGANVTINFNSK